ncbi:hypothetical protein A2U01_0046557 [Trifolium medium]|uniref:Uncharacterized protein n=1 Tax=Trifolium medium TaxID=97028 RepID=A0A392QP99_9FABA|nr:hypothetical protein [Trifolium medium]
MRLMKEQGVIITSDDIAQVSPQKERKDSSESDELSASEDKVTAGIEGASDAYMSKGKEPIVSDTADVGTVAATPKRKRVYKEKTEKVVEGKKKKSEVRAAGVATSVSNKEKITKKPRTQKKKVPKIVRKLVIQGEDEEETDEEPL